LILLFFGISTSTVPADPAGTSQTCTISANGTERCGPALVDGRYQLPSDGVVLTAVVNNGPLPPEFQAGYEITIDVAGSATITVTEEGQPDNPVITTSKLGVDGLQDLLMQLDTCGFYYLPQRSEFADVDLPVGGSVSVLEVRLADGGWATSEVTLTGPEQTSFRACQDIVATQLGMTSPTG
jgi:hypothetical protein